jgi:DNA-binding Xre family transcriptional regulator
MEYFASIFKKKFNNILAAEKINATALANKAGITIVVSYDYRSGRATPSSIYSLKIICFGSSFGSKSNK